MKKKSNDMSFDMFNDATSSTPIPVFTTANEGNQNESQNQNPLQDVTADFTGVPNGTPVKFQAEIIKVNFDKQTVSARALYDFLDMAERFSKWWTRMVLYGLEENVDYTASAFFTITNNGKKEDIGDYLLTIEAAKHVAMVQRCEKGRQARQYFIDVEKLYLKNLYSQNQKPVTDVTTVTPIEKIRNLLVEIEGEMIPQNDYKLLEEKKSALEKKLAGIAHFYNLKDEYLERIISQKVDMALKASFREADLNCNDDFANTLPRAANKNPAVLLNQLEKNLQKITSEEDLITQYYLPAHRKTENALFLTATEITLRLEKFNPRISVYKIGMALKKLGFERVPDSKKGGRVKGYFVIQL